MIIGVTGQTGAGKSTVCKYLAERGLPVIDADLSARRVISQPEIIDALKSEFGGDIAENGAVVRKTLAERAFINRDKTDALNRIMHPAIAEDMLSAAEKYEQNGEKAVIFDAPQLFESGLNRSCALTVGITADERIRLARIIARDKLTPEQAALRISAGKPDSFFESNCDLCIDAGSCEPEKVGEKIMSIICERIANT